MKKIINFIFASLTVITLISCEEAIDDRVVLDSNATTTLNITQSGNIILDKENKETLALDFNWESPDFGYPAAPEYILWIDLESNDFSNATSINVQNELTKAFTNEEFNKLAIALEATPEVAVNFAVKLEAIIGNSTSVITESILVNITPYADKLDLSTPWGLVGDATPNSWDGPDVPFYKTDTPNEYVAYPTLVDGFIKIRKDNDWAVNYGDATLDGILDTDNDNNIAVTSGVYKITFNEITLAYSIEDYTWGLVGDATTNGWNGPDLALEYDATSDTWRAIVTLTDGFIKIRQNNDWAVNYGDATLDGILDGDNDNNIAVTAGNYLVTVNTTTLEYSIEAIDVWGIVGDATPNSWDGPDTKFSLDYAQEGVWYLNNMTLTDGLIKFRTNDDWGVNYGDATLDGVLDGDNDNNISVTAGVYDFTLDFSDPNTPKYTMTKK